MATDRRITQAKRALAEGVAEAAKLTSSKKLTRSTASRRAYKAKATAADKALVILTARPGGK